MTFDPDLLPPDHPGALGLVYALAWTSRMRRGQRVYEAPLPAVDVSAMSVSRDAGRVQVVVAGQALGGAPAVWIGAIALAGGGLGSVRADVGRGVMQLRVGEAAAVPAPKAAVDCAGE